jgi:Ca2+-binding RTX toxin-like protein
VLTTGNGPDVVYGGSGTDRAIPGDGNDLVYSGTGVDCLGIIANDGDTGDDTLYGGAGNDDLTTSGGDDHLFGGAGKDLLNMDTPGRISIDLRLANQTQ